MSLDADVLGSALTSSAYAHGERQGFWRLVERVKDVLYLDVTAFDDESFLLELQCDRFGEEPIRGRFVDSKTRQCISDAWPRGSEVLAGWIKWDTGNLFICWPGDRGGVEHHSEWRARRYWRETDNQLVQYLEFIRQCLNIPARGYLPRTRKVA